MYVIQKSRIKWDVLRARYVFAFYQGDSNLRYKHGSNHKILDS